MKLLAQQVALGGAFEEDLISWLQTKAEEHGLKYLLIIADDAVGFGKYEGGDFLVDAQVEGVLHPGGVKKIQQLYLFGDRAQILIWREGHLFKGSLIEDTDLPEKDADGVPPFAEEVYYLWGGARENQEDPAFTLLEEPERGFKLRIPLKILPKKQAGLKVRHYYQEDDEGQLYIAFSRLVDIVEI